MGDGSGLAEVMRRALGGDAEAMRSFVAEVLPIVQARVLRCLWRATPRFGGRRAPGDEVDDLIQDVFVVLFAQDARALRAWDPKRGLSLPNFVGMLAEHEVSSFLRTGRRSAGAEQALPPDELVVAAGPTESLDEQLASRELLAALLKHLRAELSPRAQHLFQTLVVEQRSVEEVGNELSMSTDALYAWRSRLIRRAREIAAELQSSARSDVARRSTTVQENREATDEG